MTVDAGRPPVAATFPPIPFHRRLYGFGSIYGKTIRDSRLAFIIAAGLLGGLALFMGAAVSSVFPTPAARLEVDKLIGSMPASMVNLFGKPVELGTLGGYMTFKYGAIFALGTALWSIFALSGTLAGEARRGSLDFVATAPFGKRRIALEKLAAHVTAVALSMTFLVVATLVASSVFGVPELGDDIPLSGAVGFALWVGLMGLVSGSVAFALAPIVGRGSAAGVAGAVLLGSFILGGYAPYVPALEPIATLSWFHWTYDHVPLAGQYDWASLGLVALATVALFAVGVELFARRDLGVMTGIPVPGLPRATLGLRGPVGRSFGDQLPQALAWGVGIGVFGFMLAAMSRSFSESLTTEYPTFADLIEAIFPTVDFTSAGWFLQLIFVEMGLVVVGFSAATFVGRWASDEETGRLEMVLAAPLTRARWAIAGGVGALLAVAVTTAVYALGIALGAAVAGSEIVTPTAGTIALGFYAAAMVGIGVAIGGLWRTSWAAELVAAIVIGTFLIGLLAPALKMPDWIQQLALTAHLGQPMIGTWDWAGMVACAVLAIGGILLGAWGMARRDVV